MASYSQFIQIYSKYKYSVSTIIANITVIQLYLFLIFIIGSITDVLIFPSFAHLHPAPNSPSLRPSPHCCLCPWVMHIYSLANPFPFFHSVLPPCPHFQDLSVCSMYIHASGFILFIRFCSFCSLDSTCK